MDKFRAVLTGAITLTLLAGCSVFYPNWGADGLPEESISESPTAEETPTQTQSPEPTQTPSQSVKPKAQATVDILVASVDEELAILTVVAQIPSISESDGTCTVRFLGGSVDKTFDVAAEPSSGYTQCFPIEIPLSDLPSGNGVVTVTYESDKHIGESAVTSVVIP